MICRQKNTIQKQRVLKRCACVCIGTTNRTCPNTTHRDTETQTHTHTYNTHTTHTHIQHSHKKQTNLNFSSCFGVWIVEKNVHVPNHGLDLILCVVVQPPVAQDGVVCLGCEFAARRSSRLKTSTCLSSTMNVHLSSSFLQDCCMSYSSSMESGSDAVCTRATKRVCV